MDIVLATRNKKKAEEMRRILSEVIPGVRILTLDDFPACPEVKEDGETFEANAIKKARHVSAFTGLRAIADDSGLEVEALGGAPGVLSARYAGKEADDAKNLSKLLQEMRDVPEDKRGARFVCCIALANPDGDVRTFTGYVKGRIGREPKGTNGFGYDPVFYPEGYDRTFAEMSSTEKDALSHRGMALRMLRRYFKENPYG